MPRFFSDFISGDRIVLTGDDARHLSKAQRAKAGDHITVCDCRGTDYQCAVDAIGPDSVTLKILSASPTTAEPHTSVTLYQALPKGDKFDFIVEKAVELGVTRIVPVLTVRCVSRPSPSSVKGKLDRWNKISLEAAKQSGRGIVPPVSPLLTLEEAFKEMSASGCPILFYEDSDNSVSPLLTGSPKAISILVGSEGGFDPQEAEMAARHGIHLVTLGPRILRCETAAVAALSVLFYATGNMDLH